MNKSISAVILTKNEESNIDRCLESLKWCDEIIVIDDYSEDQTLNRIKNYELRTKKKIRICQRRLEGNFSAQRNFGLEKASGEWILFVDADEVISAELASEIRTLKQNLRLKTSTLDGFYIKRNDFFLGRSLKYGETGNISFIRLARKGTGKWVGNIHEEWQVKGKIGQLKNSILHFPHPTISSFLSKINFYTDLVAQKWQREGKRVSFWQILVFPKGKFLQNYILRLGFLDGIPGLIIAMMMSFHSFLARGKLWLRINNA